MKIISSFAAAAVLSLFIFHPSLFGAEGEALSTATAVRTVTPSPATTERTYEIPGRTEPYESVAIYTRATGIVRERRFDIGDMVKTDDILATIDAPEIDREVDTARAALDQSNARSKNARVLAKRSDGLLSSRAISLEESEERTTNADEADASVRAAQAALDRFLELQKFATVRAPFDAVVTARNFDRGDHVRGDSSGTDDWLYRIARIDKLRFAVNATPDIALRIAIGSSANVTFTELPGRIFNAAVARSSRVFDTTTGTMRIELLLENPTLELPAGLTGTATFTLKPPPGTFLVPTNALLTQAGKTTVAIVRNNRVLFATVIVGRNTGANVEVTSNALADNTPTIVNPNAMLRTDDPVEAIPVAQTASR